MCVCMYVGRWVWWVGWVVILNVEQVPIGR